MNDLEQIAEEMYNHACSERAKTKNPREVGCEFKDLLEEPKKFYRSLAAWHLKKLDEFKKNGSIESSSN